MDKMKKILIVDDVLDMILSENGFVVDSYETTNERRRKEDEGSSTK